MYFKQYYLGCLAHASYLIGCSGEAVVVDPQRDVDLYVDEAEKQGLTIRHVLETHLHADFVSGHRELARRTGAKIYFGHQAKAMFDHVAVQDGDEIRLGKLVLRFLETPGHTPESISIVVFDTEKSADPEAVFTGDTLFIGDVGRPDLLGARMPATELAGMLYDSLHNKLLTLPDSTKVYPAHGAGSMCGRNISKDTSSTIGEQRRFNYALQPMSRETFVGMMTTDLPEAPAYFSGDALINREGPALLEELPAPAPLAAPEVDRLHKQGHVVLDTRSSDQFGTGHIADSLNIGLTGQFASWAGCLIPLKMPIILVAEDLEHVRESRVRLARVGHENVVGYLEGGILSWHQAGLPLSTTEQITVDELDRRIKEQAVDQVIDVRRPGEWQSGHIRAAKLFPLSQLAQSAEQLAKDRSIAVICAGGYRSSAATSVLERLGFKRITNVVGGMNAWQTANLETTT
jgi:glyoxylase-like metal-dependent hydrolase (beta-lactamase superfamily II)